MNTFGNTCPMCCGDLDDAANPGTGAVSCAFCGHNAEAPVSNPPMARRPEATAFSASPIATRDPDMTQETSRLDAAVA